MSHETDPTDTHPEVKRILRLIPVVDKFGLDIDDFLFNLRLAVTRKYNSDHGTQYTPGHITEYNSVRNWLIAQGYSFEEADTMQNSNYWDNPDVLMSAPLIRGARELTLALRREKKNIYPTTSRDPQLNEMTRRQLRLYLGWIPEENLRIRLDGDPDKHGFKGRTAEEEEFGVFFENYPPHAGEILLQADTHVAICPYYPSYELEYPEVVSNPRVIKLPSLGMLAEALDPFMPRLH